MRNAAKNFAYICFGLMCLTVAYHIGVEESQADVNPAGNIHAMNSAKVLTTNGEVWGFDGELSSWYRREDLDPPVPVAEIVMWEAGHFVTSSGEFWNWHFQTGWDNWGDPSSTAVPDKQSMSGLRSLFGK